jgi:hypothetical protein
MGEIGVKVFRMVTPVVPVQCSEPLASCAVGSVDCYQYEALVAVDAACSANIVAALAGIDPPVNH